jgi:glyoxylase-like metal-dependent hydrolase (beta-lactamase superfamily II)
VNLVTAGGIGEHGRSCFLLEGAETSVLLDAGIMPGAEDPYPRLSGDQIQKCGWLFLSHSHQDHSGALPWLVEQGFRGRLVTTAETFRQLALLPTAFLPTAAGTEKPVFVEEIAKTGETFSLPGGLSVSWGRSGHCAGSVWFRVTLEGKTVLYSGDYIEDSLVYVCDPVRGEYADTAIVDSAYGSDEQDHEAYRRYIADFISALPQRKKTVLFPVPKYGRGLELMLLISRLFPSVPLYADAHLCSELRRIEDAAFWIQARSLPELRRLSPHLLEREVPPRCMAFIADPQLRQPDSRELAEAVRGAEGVILITGNTDQGSHSEALLKNAAAVFARYPVHSGDSTRNLLCANNTFARCLSFHSDMAVH